MRKRELLCGALAAMGGLGGWRAARAQPTHHLTVAAVHPATTPWVKLISTEFVPEVNRRVAALGRGLSIHWRELYGGQLYKMNAALSSVSDGITDLGWVLSSVEPARLPLLQFSSALPFACNDLRTVQDVSIAMFETVPELAQAWEHNNVVLLGAQVTDCYQLFTRERIADYGALRGLRLSAPGALGPWLRGSGAVGVDGSLASYYTDIQTGVSDGTISIVSGVRPLRVHEVAPHVTIVDLGCQFAGGLAMNRDRFLALPVELQQIFREAGQRYARLVGGQMALQYEEGLKEFEAAGATHAKPVTVTRWPEAEREKWARSLPNLAADWVQQQRSPAVARRIVRAYMEGLRQRGAKPLRDWDREV